MDENQGETDSMCVDNNLVRIFVKYEIFLYFWENQIFVKLLKYSNIFGKPEKGQGEGGLASSSSANNSWKTIPSW